MAEKITINGVTYSRTVPPTMTFSCKGCVAHDPNAEEDTDLCKRLTFEYKCRFDDNMWEIAKPTVKRIECWAYVSRHWQVVINSHFETEDDAWFAALGDPSDSDIEWAKKRGDRVCRVTVEIPE